MTERFTLLENAPINDSMCYDSGTFICFYGTDDEYVQVVTRGYVKVFWKDDCYRHFTDMPEELQKMFLDGSVYNIPDEVITEENNWFDIEYIKNGEYISGDVFDIGTPCSAEQLEKDCKEMFEYYKKQLANEPVTGGN